MLVAVYMCQDGYYFTVMYTVALFYITTDFLGPYIITSVHRIYCIAGKFGEH